MAIDEKNICIFGFIEICILKIHSDVVICCIETHSSISIVFFLAFLNEEKP